jgi:hypothetical protein
MGEIEERPASSVIWMRSPSTRSPNGTYTRWSVESGIAEKHCAQGLETMQGKVHLNLHLECLLGALETLYHLEGPTAPPHKRKIRKM